MRAAYGDLSLRLLPAGAFDNGNQVTDNVTRFAFSATRADRIETTYFETAQRGGRSRVVTIVQLV